MKITLPNGTKIEMDDAETPEPMPETATKTKSTPEAKPMDTKLSASTPKPKEPATASAPKQPKPAEVAPAKPEPAKPEENYSPRPSGDFDHMGGICNISDPNAGKPGYFQFQPPREE